MDGLHLTAVLSTTINGINVVMVEDFETWQPCRDECHSIVNGSTSARMLENYINWVKTFIPEQQIELESNIIFALENDVDLTNEDTEQWQTEAEDHIDNLCDSCAIHKTLGYKLFMYDNVEVWENLRIVKNLCEKNDATLIHKKTEELKEYFYIYFIIY